jgi:hypothetical protein
MIKRIHYYYFIYNRQHFFVLLTNGKWVIFLEAGNVQSHLKEKKVFDIGFCNRLNVDDKKRQFEILLEAAVVAA